MKTIGIASDHAGFSLKTEIINYLKSKNYSIKDFGAFSEDSVDYPDFAHPLAVSLKNGETDIGIAMCGSGNGINMTLNKHSHIRSALCWTTEIAEMARLHNDANICTVPARYIDKNLALNIVDIFLNTEFEGGRHLNRINKIPVKK